MHILQKTEESTDLSDQEKEEEKEQNDRTEEQERAELRIKNHLVAQQHLPPRPKLLFRRNLNLDDSDIDVDD
jgi:hypothetical protein